MERLATSRIYTYFLKYINACFAQSICEDEIDNIDTEICYKYMNIHEYKPTFKSTLFHLIKASKKRL